MADSSGNFGGNRIIPRPKRRPETVSAASLAEMQEARPDFHKTIGKFGGSALKLPVPLGECEMSEMIENLPLSLTRTGNSSLGSSNGQYGNLGTPMPPFPGTFGGKSPVPLRGSSTLSPEALGDSGWFGPVPLGEKPGSFGGKRVI